MQLPRRRSPSALQLCPQLTELLLHLRILMSLADASEVGVDFALEVEALAALAGDVGRFLGYVAT